MVWDVLLKGGKLFIVIAPPIYLRLQLCLHHAHLLKSAHVLALAILQFSHPGSFLVLSSEISPRKSSRSRISWLGHDFPHTARLRSSARSWAKLSTKVAAWDGSASLHPKLVSETLSCAVVAKACAWFSL